MPNTTPPRANLRIHNQGAEVVEVVLEPWARSYWLQPSEAFVVTTIGREPGSWPGTTYPDEPFEVIHGPASIIVHCNGIDAYVTDGTGTEIEACLPQPERTNTAGTPSP
ncbi:hypothetical protein GCM10009557_09410 [Virgisporangium ochraceum]|uniref:Uncharacterized protein n=1 Tax=Virgisporangium ochraceum TaxID=65505 RepID=A0A8J4EDD9_9ACTN|nr:hypothetical protein [Virgisporangium ochraceum]GIJ71410.1 hypothetical protein Voc01_063270 [Virgisporangium ochraceum]